MPDKVKSEVSTVKNFSYEKDGLNLSFSLPIKKGKLEDFKELLFEAIKDVNQAIMDL